MEKLIIECEKRKINNGEIGNIWNIKNYNITVAVIHFKNANKPCGYTINTSHNNKDFGNLYDLVGSLVIELSAQFGKIEIKDNKGYPIELLACFEDEIIA